jgi:protein-S-isoprenylcysteine O-methyltransferase Ste14
VSTGRQVKTLFVLLRALLYGSAFVFLWWRVALAVRSLDRRIAAPLGGWGRIPGIGLMAAGGLIVLICLGAFAVRGRGTPAPFDPPREFVASGPYRYVRNPMYIGGWLLVLGLGFYEGSPAILLTSLLWLLLAHLFVLFYEEPNMERRFGESYRSYRRSVRRWIPRRH